MLARKGSLGVEKIGTIKDIENDIVVEMEEGDAT